MAPVYDRNNRDRLLGHHPTWPGDRYRRFMVSPPLGPVTAPDLVPCSVTYTHVVMERSCRYTDSGLEDTDIIVTHAPLQDLMMLRDFTLPGESPRQAEARRRLAAHLWPPTRNT